MKPAPSPRDLHTQAARNHDEVAQFHRSAALCHGQNEDAAAQVSAQSAMACCVRAWHHSEAACQSTEQVVAQGSALAKAGELPSASGTDSGGRRPQVGTLHLKPRPLYP